MKLSCRQMANVCCWFVSTLMVVTHVNSGEASQLSVISQGLNCPLHDSGGVTCSKEWWNMGWKDKLLRPSHLQHNVTLCAFCVSSLLKCGGVWSEHVSSPWRPQCCNVMFLFVRRVPWKRVCPGSINRCVDLLTSAAWRSRVTLSKSAWKATGCRSNFNLHRIYSLVFVVLLWNYFAVLVPSRPSSGRPAEVTNCSQDVNICCQLSAFTETDLTPNLQNDPWNVR